MAQIIPSHKPVVLIVEDETLLRLNAIDALERSGFEVKDTYCAELAMRILEDKPDIRLIVTDIQMPGAFDGMELVRRVQRRWPHIRIVVTSSCSRPPSAEMPDDGRFISKPYPAGELVAQVNDLLRIQ